MAGREDAGFYEENRPEPPTDELVPILLGCIRDAERARIDSPVYGRRGEAREVWHFLAQHMREARRRAPSRKDLARLYAKLCECLDRGQRFDPSSSS